MSIERLRDKSKVPGNDWYIGRNQSWPGIAVALRVDEVLHQSRSKYQDITIIRKYVLLILLSKNRQFLNKKTIK